MYLMYIAVESLCVYLNQYNITYEILYFNKKNQQQKNPLKHTHKK